MRQIVRLVGDLLAVRRLVWVHECRPSVRNEQVDGTPSLLGAPLLRKPAGRLERGQIQRHDLHRGVWVCRAQLLESRLCLVWIAAGQHDVTVERGQVGGGRVPNAGVAAWRRAQWDSMEETSARSVAMLLELR